MTTTTLAADHAPMGAAILDHTKGICQSPLTVHSSMFDDDEMPIDHLFRSLSEMPRLEQEALSRARGRVLDIGAGAGCHTLALQERCLEVKAIDISPLSCEAMRLRGVSDVECTNLFSPLLEGTYDTILLLMNGTGLAGKVSGMPRLLDRLKQLLTPGGQILIDSSDLRYLFDDDDLPSKADGEPYYGEVDYQMTYAGVEGAPFDWLYLDYPLLEAICQANGLKCECIMRGDHYDYLAKVSL